LIEIEEKRRVLELIKEAISSGARKRIACETMGISIRSFQRWDRSCARDCRKGAAKIVPRKLSDEERQKVKDTACCRDYKDLTPYEIVALLAEKGEYIASERTFYRILEAEGLLHHRGNGKPPVRAAEPKELVATGPDQIWSWDITWLRTEVRGLFYYAYVVKDIWTKDMVGWEIHDREDDELASALFVRLRMKHGMKGLYLRSDNGNPMKGATMLMTLYNLGVIPSYGRPRVSNDNPFIESLFKTLKYTAGYPGQFKDIEHARRWMANFVNWYNTEHRHSSLGYVTPQQRRRGDYKEIFEKRNETLARAKERNPERWVRKQKVWGCDDAVFLNPSKETKENLMKKSA
jgi:transposase InsO family protein